MNEACSSSSPVASCPMSCGHTGEKPVSPTCTRLQRQRPRWSNILLNIVRDATRSCVTLILHNLNWFQELGSKYAQVRRPTPQLGSKLGSQYAKLTPPQLGSKLGSQYAQPQLGSRTRIAVGSTNTRNASTGLETRIAIHSTYTASTGFKLGSQYAQLRCLTPQLIQSSGPIPWTVHGIGPVNRPWDRSRGRSTGSIVSECQE